MLSDDTGYEAVQTSPSLSPLERLEEHLNPFTHASTPRHSGASALSSMIWLPLTTLGLIVIHCAVFYSYIDQQAALAYKGQRCPPCSVCTSHKHDKTCFNCWGNVTLGEPCPDDGVTVEGFIGATIIALCQVGVTLLALYLVYTHFDKVHLVGAWIFYCGAIISFSGMYLYLGTVSSFLGMELFYYPTTPQGIRLINQTKGDPFATMDQGTAVGNAILFLYFSCATQTHTGFGDITPAHVITQSLGMIQMVFGMVYILIIISETVERMGNGREPHRRPSTTWQRFTHIDRLHRIRGLIRENLLLFTVVVQAINYTILCLDDEATFAVTHKQHQSQIVWSIALPQLITMIIQLFQVGIVMIVSWKYVRRAQEVRVHFVLQCFLATTLSFAGVHVMVYLLDDGRTGYNIPCKFRDAANCGGGGDDAGDFWSAVFAFFYFSLTIMTSTGYGDIFARSGVARLIVTVQMVVQVLFTVVIFGLGMRYLKVHVPSYPLESPPESPYDPPGGNCEGGGSTTTRSVSPIRLQLNLGRSRSLPGEDSETSPPWSTPPWCHDPHARSEPRRLSEAISQSLARNGSGVVEENPVATTLSNGSD